MYEKRHQDQFPDAEVFIDNTYKREMIRVVSKNTQGGKFIITTKRNQDRIVSDWLGGKKVTFYDSIEEAVTSFLKKE
ncbi:hypothetical protein D3C71_1455560 [compost metagenome]